MDLDSKIKPNKTFYTAYDIEETKLFLGSEGYFTSNMSAFSDIKKYNENMEIFRGYLTEISTYENAEYPFQMNKGGYYRFFLPLEFIKDDRRNYRQYSLSEFRDKFKLLDRITMRVKNEEESIIDEVYLGYHTNLDGVYCVTIGHYSYYLEELFESYELYDNKNECWIPFGVKY